MTDQNKKTDVLAAAGEALTRLQSRHQLILDAAGEGIYGLNSDGKINFSNATATDILGWNFEDLLGRCAHELFQHSHADGSPYPREQCLIDTALHDGESHRVDNEVFWHFDGTSIPVEYVSTPIMCDGAAIGVVVIFRDISKRLEAETQSQAAHQELLQLKAAYQAILDSAGEGIYGLDNEGQIRFGNAAAAAIVGWHSDDVIGQRAHEVHHHSYSDGSSYPREDCPIYAALRDGEVHSIDDEVFWHADGSAIPVEYTSTPILKDGEPDGAVVIFRDVSQRKALEQEREAAFEQIKLLKDQLEQERDYLRDEIAVTSNFGAIIGQSQALKRTLAQIEAVASTPANVLILGESGVGKEMVARAIHQQSKRADKPLVKVNCASIPEDLFESEFFGHVKGAFTSAHRDRVGRLQLAAGGTLFLDEIGEIPLSLQGKLLRALQEHEFERVGDEKTIKVDVRIVAATNRKLEEDVKTGRFREDLYYRISVFPIEVPALRDRIEDIGPLASHFLELICRDFGKDPLQLTRHHLSILEAHHWHGNIRELRNVIERAVISSTSTRLRLDLALPQPTNVNVSVSTHQSVEDLGFLTDLQFREMEKANIIAALRTVRGQIWGDDGAAALLGIKPSTLTYRMNVFDIKKDESTG